MASEMKEFRLAEIKVVEIDKVPIRVGRFELKNTLPRDLTLRGWAKEPGFFIEYPASRIQLRANGWVDVTPMIGSFISDGDHKVTIRSGDAGVFLARVDFGVRAGHHDARLVLQTPNDDCLLSRPFALVVP